MQEISRRFRADETHNHTSLPHGRRAILENPVVAVSNALFRGAVGSSFATSFKSGHSTLSTDWLDPEDDLPDSPLSDDICGRLMQAFRPACEPRRCCVARSEIAPCGGKKAVAAFASAPNTLCRSDP